MTASTHTSPAAATKPRAWKKHAVLAPAMLTVEQVGQRLALSSRTVERLAKAGSIPAPILMGRSARWTIASIDALVNGTWKPAPDAPDSASPTDGQPPAPAAHDAAAKLDHRERDR